MRSSLALVLAVGTVALADFTFDQLWTLQNTFWDNFLYPANLQQINATDTSVFAENVRTIPFKPPTRLHVKTNLQTPGARPRRHNTHLRRPRTQQ
jgi:hypothetical protein